MSANQKNNLFIAFVIFLLIIIFLFTFQRYNKTSSQEKIIPEILSSQEESDPFSELSILSVDQLIDANLSRSQIIDMRSKSLYDTRHIRGSIHASSPQANNHVGKDIIIVIDSTVPHEEVLKAYNTLSPDYTISLFRDSVTEYEASGGLVITRANPEEFADLLKVSFVEPRELYDENDGSQDITILDVRRQGNYEDSHILNAINIPLSELEERFREIPTTALYVYGADDAQSFQAGALLSDLGFLTTKTVSGGITAWKEFNYPLSEEK